MPQTGSIAVAGVVGLSMLVIYTLRGYGSSMDDRLKKSQLARLARIEGQVRGLARMVEDDRYCIDIITQVRAVRAALAKVEQDILHDHLQHCVAHAFHAGSEKDRQIKIDELIEVLDSRQR
jgi:DNA-binding FrmR family transcriptional regulator